MDWTVTSNMLSLSGRPRELRNLSVVLSPIENGPELGRSYCSYPIEITVASGDVVPSTILPKIEISMNGLTANCKLSGLSGVTATWDFGDGSPLTTGSPAQHDYLRPGPYEILVRLVRQKQLAEYRATVVASEQNPVSPLIVSPNLSAGSLDPDGKVPVTVFLPSGSPSTSIDCLAGTVFRSDESGSITLPLRPGSYVMRFRAMRRHKVQFYCKQKFEPQPSLGLARSISTNRTFNEFGAETTSQANALTTKLFSGSTVLSPVDRWTLELAQSDNPWLTSVTSADVVVFDASEFADAILGLEYLTAH
jgi:hypothetical protein